jgi:hypothetical protein
VSSYRTIHASQSSLTYLRPDIITQANTDPEYAFQLWNQYFEPLVAQGYRLIGPSVTGGGHQWLQTFLGLCTNCHVGVIFVISLWS